MTEAEWDALTDEQKVEALIERMDQGRLDNQGGYPSQYEIRWGHVIHADVDHDSAPKLTISPIAEWVAENEVWMTEWFDE